MWKGVDQRCWHGMPRHAQAVYSMQVYSIESAVHVCTLER